MFVVRKKGLENADCVRPLTLYFSKRDFAIKPQPQPLLPSLREPRQPSLPCAPPNPR